MSDTYEDLNYDFNYNMYLAKTMIPNLSTQKEKLTALKWLKKLSLSTRSLEEMKLRNTFIYKLVLCIQNGRLEEPFVDDPPSGPLPELSVILNALSLEERVDAKCIPDSVEGLSPRKPVLYKYSPDGGAFLLGQPIPKCGAFCYLAVINKPKKTCAFGGDKPM